MRKLRGSPDHRPEAGVRSQCRVTVMLDEGVSHIADTLQDALGTGFHVVAFPPANDVLVVLTRASPRVVAAHRQLHPTIGLVVTGVGTEPDAVAAVLDAGADDCLRGSDPRELAARLLALSRRRAMTSGRRPRQPAKRDVDPGA